MPQFDSEQAMTLPVHQWLGARTTAVKAEFSLPWGVCDLIGVSVSRRRARQRLKLGQRTPIGSLRRVRILQAIPDRRKGGAATLRSLQRRFSESLGPETLRQELGWLIEHHFVHLGRDQSLCRIDGWSPLHQRIIAIELKLNRIREAIEQACSHQRIADEVYVALPAPVAFRLLRSPRMEEVSRAGVGVLAVWERNCRTLHSPTSLERSGPNPAVQIHCMERFWRTHRRSFL